MFLSVLPSPPFCCSKPAGTGNSSLFLLQLGWGQTRERLPTTLYLLVCQIVHGITAPVLVLSRWGLS